MSKIATIEYADKIAVFGDIHGDWESLSKGYKIIEEENIDCTIFLGDYADRGLYGPKVIEFIREKQRENRNIIPLKGNHEDYELLNSNLEPNFNPCNLIYQYKGSGEELYNWFESLPLGIIIPNKYFFVHGGISTKVAEANLEELDNRTIEHLLWSDPTEKKGEYTNSRGAGVKFGPDVTDKFMNQINVKTMIRSHEPNRAMRGFNVGQDGRILTISSTTIYGGKSAILIIDNKKPAMNAYELSEGIRIL